MPETLLPKHRLVMVIALAVALLLAAAVLLAVSTPGSANKGRSRVRASGASTATGPSTTASTTTAPTTTASTATGPPDTGPTNTGPTNGSAPTPPALSTTTLSTTTLAPSTGAPSTATTPPHPVTTVAPPATTAPPPPGLLFQDEFSGTNVDTGKWVVLNRPGDSSNQERQCYSTGNVGVGGGQLTLASTATKCGSLPYTSGAIQMRSFSFTYGTIELRSRESGGQGTWPAEWLLGVNCQQSNVSSADNTGTCAWPNPGSDEIDITEIFSGDLHSVHQGVHSGSHNPSCSPTTSDVSLSWHTYQLVWSSRSLQWKIDGVTTCTVTSGVPSTPMFLIINTAVGGIGGGTVNPSTLPQSHLVDYVRVYR